MEETTISPIFQLIMSVAMLSIIILFSFQLGNPEYMVANAFENQIEYTSFFESDKEITSSLIVPDGFYVEKGSNSILIKKTDANGKIILKRQVSEKTFAKLNIQGEKIIIIS